MSEADWMTATDPDTFVICYRSRISDRKLRLFALACCRRIEDFFTGYPIAQLFEWTECEADGIANPRLQAFVENWTEEQNILSDSWGLMEIDDQRREEVHRRCTPVLVTNEHAHQAITGLRCWNDWVIMDRDGAQPVDAELGVHLIARSCAEANGNRSEEQRAQCVCAHDIFDNAFHAVSADSAWLTSTVVGLAEGIYADRAFERLPILADALQDAGCDNENVLNHCRSEGPHVRGCWVVDLILGKT